MHSCNLTILELDYGNHLAWKSINPFDLGGQSISKSIGAQSIEHANVLSEKTHFSALGGPKVAIFGGP